MFVNHLIFRLLLSLCCLCVSVVGCTSFIRVSSTSNPLFPKKASLRETASFYEQIRTGTAGYSEIESYNKSVRDALIQLIRPVWKGEFKPYLNTSEGRVPVTVDHTAIKSFDRIDRLEISDTVTVTDGINQPHVSFGVGVPLSARIKWTETDYLIPDDGAWMPMTALLVPSDEDGVTIKLINTSSAECSCPFPIATNFTAPLARDLTARQKEFERVRAMINFERFEPHMGINRIFDFQPGQIPVVLVHGVLSNSASWANVINDLMADEEIRSRYEFWLFAYPTGAPVPYLSHQLRLDVDEMHQYRKSLGATSSEVIVLGHSMGGLMAKTLTQSSGLPQWNRFFEVSPENLEVEPEEREVLRDMFFFEPLPYIKRVVFLATPHAGAEAADRNFARFGEMLIREPQIIVQATSEVIHESLHSLTPLGIEINHDFPNSIEHMRYGSELGQIFSDLPLNPNVRYHSVIGSIEGLDVPKSKMTDGVLSYESAHIDGVISEKVVESDHGVHRDADGITEVIRILKSSD